MKKPFLIGGTHSAKALLSYPQALTNGKILSCGAWNYWGLKVVGISEDVVSHYLHVVGAGVGTFAVLLDLARDDDNAQVQEDVVCHAAQSFVTLLILCSDDVNWIVLDACQS